MDTRSSKLLTVAMTTLVLMMMAAVSAMAQSTTRSTIKDEPINIVIVQCEAPFEPITFTGFQNSVYEVKNSHDGSPLRFKSTVAWEHVVGTTPSGTTYKGKSKSVEEADLDGLPSYHVVTSTERFKSKTKGAPDLEYSLKLRIKIDADGIVTQNKESEKSECK